MTELAVNRMMDAAFDTYERDVAKPRHTENVNKLNANSDKLDTVLDVVQQIKGGLIAMKWLGAIATVAGVLLKIVAMVRGH